MRQGVGLLLVFALEGCCCNPLAKESYAQVPLTLDDARKLENFETTVTVTRQTQAGNGSIGACGHSPLCILVLPLALYGSLFPARWDEVVIAKNGTVILVGSYETGGALIHAQHLIDGEMRETRNIELKELGKKVYVDSARLVALEDGGVERVVMPLSSQHDFIGEERKHLSKVTDPHRRALAIDEARRLLEDEGSAFAKERLAAPDEGDETKAEVLRIGCGNPDFEPLIVEAQKNPGPWTKLRLVGCLTEAAQDEMLLQVVAVACDAKTPKDLVEEIAPLISVHPTDALRAAQAKCSAGPRRALVALWLGSPVDRKELDGLLASELGSLAHPHLRTTEPVHRAAMVKLAIENTNTEVLLNTLVEEKTVLEPELLESLAVWYLNPKGLFPTRARAKVLELFSFAAHAPDGAARTKSARGVLAKATQEPVIEAAQVTLGERSHLAGALKGLKSPVYFGYPASEADLITWGLTLAGCPDDEPSLRNCR